MKTTLLFSISLLFTLLSQPLMAGPEGSGGSDDFTPVSAWFRSYDNTRSVKACFEVAPDFGVSEVELTEMVRSSFNLWSSYLLEKKLLEKVSEYDLKIATSLELKSNCQGNEELKFYFGTQDSKVSQAKSQYEKPFGFAELNNPNQRFQDVWSSGYIWIANSKSIYPEEGIPTWNSSTNSLRALILHELGHVFGNGHVSGTVMTADLAKFLTNDTRPSAKVSFVSAYDSIDSLVELVPCYDCKVSYQSESGRDYLVEAYRLLTLRNPVGRLFATFNGDGLGSQEIVFTDGTGEHRFPIQLVDLIVSQLDDTPRFLGLGGIPFFSEGRSYLGEIQTPEGHNIVVAININMNQQKLSVKALQGKESKILFQTGSFQPSIPAIKSETTWGATLKPSFIFVKDERPRDGLLIEIAFTKKEEVGKDPLYSITMKKVGYDRIKKTEVNETTVIAENLTCDLSEPIVCSVDKRPVDGILTEITIGKAHDLTYTAIVRRAGYDRIHKKKFDNTETLAKGLLLPRPSLHRPASFWNPIFSGAPIFCKSGKWDLRISSNRKTATLTESGEEVQFGNLSCQVVIGNKENVKTKRFLQCRTPHVADVGFSAWIELDIPGVKTKGKLSETTFAGSRELAELECVGAIN